MYVYAVESLQKQWYTGAKHINIKSRDSKGIISLWQSLWWGVGQRPAAFCGTLSHTLQGLSALDLTKGVSTLWNPFYLRRKNEIRRIWIICK